MTEPDNITSNPFFSVVVPTYNCADLLARALSSIFGQTFQNFEVIVIDNASTDHTGRVLESIDDNRLSVIDVQNNGNIANSRNLGIQKARGDWIAFLDSDDNWLPEKLETIHAAICGTPGIVLLCHDEWIVVDGVKKSKNRYQPKISNVHESLIFFGNCLSTSAVTLRKDIANKTDGFSERRDFISVEDYEYWIRLARTGEYRFINKVLGEYHIHGSNVTKNIENHALAYISVAEHHLDLWRKEHPGSDKKVKRRRAQVWAEAAHLFLKEGDFSEARKYATRALSFDPFGWKSWAIIGLSIMHIPI